MIGKNVPDEPEETLGGDVLLGGELVLDEFLQVLGLGGGGELTVTNLLYTGAKVIVVSKA